MGRLSCSLFVMSYDLGYSMRILFMLYVTLVVRLCDIRSISLHFLCTVVLV